MVQVAERCAAGQLKDKDKNLIIGVKKNGQVRVYVENFGCLHT